MPTGAEAAHQVADLVSEHGGRAAQEDQGYQQVIPHLREPEDGQRGEGRDGEEQRLATPEMNEFPRLCVIVAQARGPASSCPPAAAR